MRTATCMDSGKNKKAGSLQSNGGFLGDGQTESWIEMKKI